MPDHWPDARALEAICEQLTLRAEELLEPLIVVRVPFVGIVSDRERLGERMLDRRRHAELNEG